MMWNMIYGTRQYKNGKRTGLLIFSTGKRVFLNKIELKEFENKIDYWREIERERAR